MNVRLEWLNVFADNEETLDQHFEQLGKQFFDLYNILKASQPIRFALSNQQQKQFNSFFAQVQKEYSNLFGLDIVASVRRLVVITFRIAMILSLLRIIDGKEPSNPSSATIPIFEQPSLWIVCFFSTPPKFSAHCHPPKRQQTAIFPQLSNKHSSITFRQSSTAKLILLLRKNWKFQPKQPKSISANFVSAACSNTLHTTVTTSRNIVICTFQKPLKMGLYIYLLTKNIFFMPKNISVLVFLVPLHRYYK